MINICEMKDKDIPTVVSFLDNTTEDFMNQWGGMRWYKYPVTIEQMIKVYNTRKGTTLYFLIKNDDEVIGSFELDFIDWENSECAVCRFLIADEYRSKGYGTQAMKVLVNHAFMHLCMKRIYLSAFDFNIGAIKCYENAGFKKFEEVVRDNGWVAIRMEIFSPAVKYNQ